MRALSTRLVKLERAREADEPSQNATERRAEIKKLGEALGYDHSRLTDAERSELIGLWARANLSPELFAHRAALFQRICVRHEDHACFGTHEAPPRASASVGTAPEASAGLARALERGEHGGTPQ